MPRSIALPGLAPPRRLSVLIAAVNRTARPRSPTQATARRSLTQPPKASAASRTPKLSASGKPRASSTPAAAKRKLKKSSGASCHPACPSTSVEIVCASPAVSAARLGEGHPLRLARDDRPGHRRGQTRPGRALLAFTEWIEDDFAAGRLRRMFESGDVRLDDDQQAHARPRRATARAGAGRMGTRHLPPRASAVSPRRRVGRRSATTCRRTRATAWTGARDEAEWLGDVDRRARRVRSRRQTHPASSICRTSPRAARAFVSRPRRARERARPRRRDRARRRHRRAPGARRFSCRSSEALRFLRERVESVTVGADRPRPGHLYVSALTTAGLSGRPHVFVVGLEEGRVFPLRARGSGPARRRARCGSARISRCPATRPRRPCTPRSSGWPRSRPTRTRASR